MKYEKEFEEELKYLKEEGIENITIDSINGKITLAEILRYYGGIYSIENDQGHWGGTMVK